MANSDNPKPDTSAGLKALKSDSIPPEYPKSEIPGFVVAPCKNKDCTSAIDFGFVIDTVTWIENFKPTQLTCPNPICKLQAQYFSSDLVPVTAKR